MTMEELEQAGDTWKQVHLSTMISKQNTESSFHIPEYDLEHVWGKVQTTMKIVIPPFETIMVKYKVRLNIHSKCIYVMIEPIVRYSKHVAMAHTHGVFKPGTSKETISLCNMSTN